DVCSSDLAVHLDEVALLEQPERAVDAGDEARDRRLARARVPEEHEVPRERRARQSRLRAQLLDAQELGLAMDLVLDPGEAGERVELGEQLVEGADRLLLGGGRRRLARRRPCPRRPRLSRRGRRVRRGGTRARRRGVGAGGRAGACPAPGTTARPAPDCWTAAVAAAAPATCGPGEPRSAAARATSASACPYAAACFERAAPSAARTSVGEVRHRRALDAAVKNAP